MSLSNQLTNYNIPFKTVSRRIIETSKIIFAFVEIKLNCVHNFICRNWIKKYKKNHQLFLYVAFVVHKTKKQHIPGRLSPIEGFILLNYLQQTIFLYHDP